MSTEAIRAAETGGFTGDPAEAFAPAADGGCCGSGAATTSGCCGTAAAGAAESCCSSTPAGDADTAASCCG